MMTSHKTPGKTASHVVVAAAKLDEKAALWRRLVDGSVVKSIFRRHNT
ncbi:MAG TPA: hypothetical protein VJK54_07520 [Chthoniobacterales bacterium]|nr:hypothetical protein [Chthoniobacterales bacterium]